MKNFDLECPNKNVQKNSNGKQYHVEAQTQKTEVTSYREVETRKEMQLTGPQLNEVSWLFKQYGMQKPGWLRRRFKLNQRRVKVLNDVIYEAQLGSIYCGIDREPASWSDLIHVIWHSINGEELCK